MNAQPENNSKNNDNVWENIKIEEDKAEGGQIISYIKKGRGLQRTKRPLGAVRLELVLDELKMSQSELARRIDSGQSTISKIISGETRNSHLLESIAKVVGKNKDWLAGNETNDKNIAVINNNSLFIEQSPFTIVNHYYHGKEGLELSDLERKEAKSIIIVSNDQITNIQNRELRFIIEPDRAMSPEIKAGACVTFDTLDKNITNGDMFVVQTGNQIFTRCLYVQPNNSILIRAKESDFPDYTISRSEESFSILGRVVYVANKI